MRTCNINKRRKLIKGDQGSRSKTVHTRMLSTMPKVCAKTATVKTDARRNPRSALIQIKSPLREGYVTSAIVLGITTMPEKKGESTARQKDSTKEWPK